MEEEILIFILEQSQYLDFKNSLINLQESVNNIQEVILFTSGIITGGLTSFSLLRGLDDAR